MYNSIAHHNCIITLTATSVHTGTGPYRDAQKRCCTPPTSGKVFHLVQESSFGADVPFFHQKAALPAEECSLPPCTALSEEDRTAQALAGSHVD